MTPLGTGNLSPHRLDNERDEFRAVQAELHRIGLKSVSEADSHD